MSADTGCGECGRTYRTRLALRLAYAASGIKAARLPLFGERWRDRLGLAWDAITRAARDIYFCPRCGHNW